MILNKTDSIHNEIIAGFDARIMWLDFKKKWGGRTGQRSIITLKVESVVSIDQGSWTSSFNKYGVYCSNGDYYLHYSNLQRPFDATDGYFEMWSRLGDLQKFITANYHIIKKPSWVVCFTVLDSPDISDTLRINLYLMNVEPSIINKEWCFLGYDIVDQYLLSGLTHCFYGDDEKKYLLSKSWIKDLNSNHLFDSFEAADQFRLFRNNSVLEHAPFIICGIYLIEKLDGDNSL